MIGRLLQQLLWWCPGTEVEGLRLARRVASEDPGAWTLFDLARALERAGKLREATRAYRTTLSLARREGEPGVSETCRIALRELAEGNAATARRKDTARQAAIEAGKLPREEALAALLRCRRAAHSSRAWAEEESCLRDLVVLTRKLGDTKSERRWALRLARHYPGHVAFWMLGLAETHSGRPSAARRAFRTARLLATKIGDHDLRAEIDTELARLKEGAGQASC
jgi:hypothetical protein